MDKLTKSLEKYLYSIYKLSNEKTKITPKDIGSILGFNAASTLEGIKALQKKGLIEYKPYKGVIILDSGKKYARMIEQRKNTTALFLEKSEHDWDAPLWMNVYFPVEPKPPVPRCVSSSSSTIWIWAWTTGTTISWAMRSAG